MIEWTVLLTPLVVLPIVLLFRFVGCGTTLPEEPVTQQFKQPVDYPKYILGDNPPGADAVPSPQPQFQPKKANVIAYWRLVEPGLDPGVAADQAGFQNGEFKRSTSVETKPGDFAPGQSLLDSAPTDNCRFFNGGFVFVDYKSGLYTDQFTIEAWVNGAFTSGPSYTLFDATGHYRRPFENTEDFHGFRVLVEGGRWQIRLAGAPDSLFLDKGPLVSSGRHHVAVGMEDSPLLVNGKRFYFYINGKYTTHADTQDYSRPDGAPLLIGVGRETADPANMAQLIDPVRGHVQEVVLHRKSLSGPELENHVFINKAS
jgi:hypothetical protein